MIIKTMGKNNYPEQCKCCFDYLSIEKDRLIYQWSLCSAVVPKKPSIDRKKGGHLILFPHRHIVKRSDLYPQEAISLMRASMIIEQSMYDVLPELGINLVNVNIQDCGNIKVDESFEKRHLHLHFYGRVRDDKNHTHRNFLCLPPRDSKYYKNLKPFKKDEIRLLKRRIEKLDKDSRFNFNK